MEYGWCAPDFLYKQLGRGIYRVCVEVSGVSESLRLPFDLENPLSIHGLLYIWTELLLFLLADLSTWGVRLWPKLHPGVGSLGSRPF